jgi:superfamily I DNA/RNA helicase
MIWHIALDRVPDDERAYIIALLRRGEKFNAEPRITVSTIHGSKGGEAENVVLYTNLSPAADAHYQTNPDDLHRTFYVAVTRTKENLFIIEPENMNRSYDL